MTGSNADQLYASSVGSVPDAGFCGATSLHTSVKRTVFTPSESSVLRRESSVPGPQRSQASSWIPKRADELAAACPANRNVAVAASAAVIRSRLMQATVERTV